MESESYSLSSENKDFRLEIISLIDDSEMEGVSRDSFFKRHSSSDSSKALFSGKVGGGKDHIEKQMPPLVLTKVEIEGARKMREHAGDFVQIYQGMNGYKPSVAKIGSHLGYRGKSNDVSWIRLGDHFKEDGLVQKGIRLVDLDNANKYYWVTN